MILAPKDTGPPHCLPIIDLTCAVEVLSLKERVSPNVAPPATDAEGRSLSRFGRVHCQVPRASRLIAGSDVDAVL